MSIQADRGVQMPDADPRGFAAALARALGANPEVVDRIVALVRHFNRLEPIEGGWTVSQIKKNPGAVLRALGADVPQLLFDGRRKLSNEAVAISPDLFVSMVEAAVALGAQRYATGVEMFEALARDGSSTPFVRQSVRRGRKILPREAPMSLGAALGRAVPPLLPEAYAAEEPEPSPLDEEAVPTPWDEGVGG